MISYYYVIGDLVKINEDYITSPFYTDKVLKIKYVDYENHMVCINKKLFTLDDDDDPFKISAVYIRLLNTLEKRMYHIQDIVK